LKKNPITIPTLKRESILPYFAGGVLICSGAFIFYVYRSFAWSAFFAVLLYIGFESANKRLYIMVNKRKTVSATISTIFVFITIFVPLIILFQYILKEVVFVIVQIRDIMTFEKGLTFLQRFPYILDFITSDEFFWVSGQGTFLRFLENYGNYLDPEKLDVWLENIYSIFLGSMTFTISFAADILFTVILMFFMFRDGPRLYNRVVRSLPIPEELIYGFLNRMREIIFAVLKGSVFISILQGIMLSIGLILIGIPNSILYGTIGAVFSLIPIVGTAIIWLPVSLYLAFIQNAYWTALFFALYGLGMYLFLENIFKPRFLDEKLGIHSLFLFFSIIGGIKEFGIPGIILGPLFVALFSTLWSIYHIWESDTETVVISQETPDKQAE